MLHHRPEDLAFYEALGVPAPTLDPISRRKRRLIFRNERSLYRSTCNATGKSILSMYAPEKGFTVYDFRYWHSDAWDALSYGREFDFSRPFFEQWGELARVVPKLNIIMDTISENSDYVSQSGNLRNCYLVFDSDNNEDSMYSHTLKGSRNCVDCLLTHNSELCYECVNCRNCYRVSYAEDCDNCSDCSFMLDCKGCKNSIGCYGLRNKEYCIFNEELTKEEYERRLAEMKLGSYLQRDALRARFEAFIAGKRAQVDHNLNCENSSGSYLRNARNSFACQHCENLDNVAFASKVFEAKDCRDYDVWGDRAELLYECVTVGENAYNIGCSYDVLINVQDIWYSSGCVRSKDLFGCVGIRDKEYCILNKQYSPEEYAALRVRIVDHMKKTGEWGQFFPASLSPFGYNETMVYDEYPLTEEQAKAEGFQWYKAPQTEQQVHVSTVDLADDISAYADGAKAQELVQGILISDGNGKPYKIVPKELAFYIKMNIPLPHLSHEERHQARCAKLSH